MALLTAQCSHGHSYDPTQYRGCPFCRASNLSDQTNSQQHPGGGSGTIAMENRVERTEALSKGTDRTLSPRRETLSMPGAKVNPPLVGWLVCVEGPNRGRDYRLHPGQNSVGRAAEMDVCLAPDIEVSRDKHAILFYDGSRNEFTACPKSGSYVVRLNGRPIDGTVRLGAGDVLQLGTTKLRFVPLCDSNFRWE